MTDGAFQQRQWGIEAARKPLHMRASIHLSVAMSSIFHDGNGRLCVDASGIGGAQLAINGAYLQLSTICREFTKALILNARLHGRPMSAWRVAIGQHCDHVNDAEEPAPVVPDAPDDAPHAAIVKEEDALLVAAIAT